MSHLNVPVVDEDYRNYWLGDTDSVIFDAESLMANYPMEWIEAVKVCWQEHSAMYERAQERKAKCESGDHEECWSHEHQANYVDSIPEVLGPEGIMFAGYLIEGPDIGAYPCKECGLGDHVVFAMQYGARTLASAIYGVHCHDGVMQARCYAD